MTSSATFWASVESGYDQILYVKVRFDVGFLDQTPATLGNFSLCLTGNFDDLLDRIRMLERQERDLMCLQGFLGDLSDLQVSRLL